MEHMILQLINLIGRTQVLYTILFFQFLCIILTIVCLFSVGGYRTIQYPVTLKQISYTALIFLLQFNIALAIKAVLVI